MLSKYLFTVLALAASVSALPTQPANTTTSTKLGISWPAQEPDSSPVDNFFHEGSKVSWWYDWDQNFDQKCPGSQSAGEFIPMVWTGDHLNNPIALQAGARQIMGFNEPDNQHEGAAKAMTPDDAANRWRQMVQEARAINPDIELISPGVAWDQNWLDSFFKLICPNGLDNCDVAPKYLSVHSYRTDPNEFIKSVESYHERFKLDIIVTEFACTDFSQNHPPPEQVSDFMAKTTAWLDATPYIYRYAWFGATRDNQHLIGVGPDNRLLDEAGNLTPLGVQYTQGGHP